MSKSIVENWQILASEPVVKSTLFSIRKDQVLNKSTNTYFDVTVMESLDSVNVIAITKNNEIIFAKQFRFGVNTVTTELPGGMLDKGEEPIDAGVRELKEETGYIGGTAQYIGKTASHPVFMNAYIHHILIHGVEDSGITKFDDGELIQVELIPIEKVNDLILKGYFDHPHTIAALSRIELK